MCRNIIITLFSVFPPKTHKQVIQLLGTGKKFLSKNSFLKISENFLFCWKIQKLKHLLRHGWPV